MLQTCSPKLFSKVSCSPKLLPKAAPQSCVLKLLPKGTPHSKLLFKATPPQSCSEQLLSLPQRVDSESGFTKLLSKAIPQSYRNRFSKQIVRQCCFQSRKVAPHSCSPKCSSKLLPKAASQRSFPKLQCCCPKLPQSWARKLSKAAPKAVPRRCSPKLCPKAVLQSCCPKAAILPTCSPKRLPKAILQSGSRKLRPKLATKSCCPKLLPQSIQSCNSSNLYPKTAPQSYSAKRLPKAAPESCY